MLVFSAFWKIVRKNIWSLAVYLVVFLLITLVLTGIGSDPKQMFSQTRIPIAVTDNDNSRISRSVYDYIEKTQNIVEIENDRDAVSDALFFRDVEYLLVIPQGFGESFNSDELMKLETTKVPDSYSGIYVDMQLEQYISSLRAYLITGMDIEEAIKAAEENAEIESEVELVIDEGGLAGHQKFSFYFRYLVYLFMAVIVQIIGTVFVVFNNKDVDRRMRCSSLTVSKKNRQLFLGSIIITMGMCIIIWSVAMAVYGEEIINSNMLWYLLANTFMLALVCTCLAYLVGTIANSTDKLSIISTTASLAMCFLSGVFVDIEIMGEGARNVAQVLPAYWYVQNNDILSGNTMLSGQQMDVFLKGTGIQLAYAAGFFVLALVISKMKNGKLRQ